MGRSNTMPLPSGRRHNHRLERAATGHSRRKHHQQPTRQPAPFNGDHHHQEPHRPSTSQRAPPLVRQDSVHTRYMEMLLGQDSIPRLHNILAAFSSWVILAGFVVFPGTFTSIQASLDGDEALKSSEAANEILGSVKHVPLVVVAAICCGVGAVGMLWLAVRWRNNYVWLLNRLFLPGVMNGLAGLISTLTSVYAQQHGEWSVTAKVTGIVEGACMGVCGVLFVVYNNLLLNTVKRKHEDHMQRWGSAPDAGENFVEKMERKAKEPGLEPGSVV